MLPNKLPLAIVALTASLAFTGSDASADLLSLRADVKAGVGGGTGMFGERKDDAFQAGHGTAGYGVAVGAEIFLIDAWVQHEQFVGGGNTSTWTQFMLGFDGQIGVGDKKGTHCDDAGKEKGGYESIMVELGMGAGFGVGTGLQVTPPLDNAQVTDKGFLLEGRIFVAHRITKAFAVGIMLPAHFGYFTKSGSGTAANNVDNHYTAAGGSAMLTLRGSVQLQ